MKIKNRIKSRQDFQKTIKTSKVIKNDEYIVYYKNNELGYLRLGVSAPTKLGNAVIRSKIRRQIKALANILIPLDKPLDIIIIARKDYKYNDNYLVNKESLNKLISLIGD